MAVNETIVTGRKWRRCIDVANKLWQRISYWTKASDVEFDDGQTAENKMGAISGITSDLNGESEKVAASIKAVNQLNNNLKGIEFITDTTGKITGYKTKVGADTVFPFSSKLTIRGTMYAEARVYNGSTWTWTNFVTKSVVFSVKNGQTNITIESDNGNISGRSVDFIRSRLVINSVSVD